MIDADGGLFDDFGGEGQFFIVAGGGAKAAFDFDDGEEDSGLFQVGVAVAEGAEQLDAAHFEILEIAAVMEITHGVHFGVADADGDSVLGGSHGGNVAGERWWGKPHPKRTYR